MKPKLIISDWNGTLFADPDDGAVLKQIGMDELYYSLLHPFVSRGLDDGIIPWHRAAGLVALKHKLRGMRKELDELPKDIDKQYEHLEKMYEIYGMRLIGGMPAQRIGLSVSRYANKAFTRLDHDTFNALLQTSCDIPCWVLTSAFDEGVAAVIGRKMGVGEIVPPADWMAKGYDLTVLGSPIDYEDSLANSVDLYYYNGTEKGAGICTVLGHMDAPQPRREEIVYMGNDERDEPVIGDVGRFVVAPMAADDFKQHMAGKYGSKVRVPERWEVYMALTSD